MCKEKQYEMFDNVYAAIEKQLFCYYKKENPALTTLLQGINDLEMFSGYDAILLLGSNLNDIRSVLYVIEPPSEEAVKMFSKKTIPVFYTSNDNLTLIEQIV